MTEQVLLYPSLFIWNRVLFFCIKVKVISAFFVEDLILCIYNFESADLFIFTSSKKSSFSQYEVLTLGIINYFLHKSPLKLQIPIKTSHHKPECTTINEVFYSLSCCGSLKHDFRLRILIRKGFEEPNS